MVAELEGEIKYQELKAHLRVLTRRKTKFSWTEVHQKHFQLIKERLCSDRVMVPFDPVRATRLYSDGGPEGGQATVTQEYQNGSLEIVRQYVETHHICTAENPQANGFVEVFNKVLVKMVHTAVTGHKDPKKVV